MRISVCITVKDEPINQLIEALVNQTLRPDEIVIADASVNPKFEYRNSKQYPKIKYLNSEGVSRAGGRNLSVKLAKNEIIAMTDAGSIPHKDWLEKLTAPYSKVHLGGVPDLVVAGFYEMVYKNNLQKSMRVYMGVMSKDFDKNFLPSTRSVAFTKSIWKKVGGFDEKFTGAGEDTNFNYKLQMLNSKFARVKGALVDWEMPKSIYKFFSSIFNYALGDTKGRLISPHNTHSLSILFRGFIFFYLLLFGYYKIVWLLLTVYCLFSLFKASFWGMVLQPVSDIAVIFGFLKGIIERVYVDIKKFFKRFFLDGLT